MWDAGLKLPTQVADGRSRCFCGAEIGIADVEQHADGASWRRSAAHSPLTNFISTPER
jgi:hypothetical protein